MSKPMFNSDMRYNNRERKATPCGNRFLTQYTARLNSHGDYVVVNDTPKDLYKEIQSHKESVDINNIVQRYMGGDLNALNRKVGTYADLTQAPKNLVHAYQMVADSGKRWNELPPDVRDLFGNSIEKFAAAISGGTIDGILKEYVDKKQAEKQAKTDESAKKIGGTDNE